MTNFEYYKTQEAAAQAFCSQFEPIYNADTGTSVGRFIAFLYSEHVNEKCHVTACVNCAKCRGETIPPWNFGQHKSKDAIVISEQDVLAAADDLADKVCTYIQNGLVQLELSLDDAVKAYRKVRKGER